MFGSQFYIFGPAVIVLLAVSVIDAAIPPNAQFAGARHKREMSSMISTLAQQFFANGGQQGVSDLSNANSESKMGVLQRYLGSALVSAMMGSGSNNNGNSNDLISRILGSFTGGGGGGGGGNTNTNYNSGSGSSNRRPSNSGGSGSNNAEPLPGSNSKTGVSIIDSRPGDRERQSANANSGTSGSSGSWNTGGNRDSSSPSAGSGRSGVSVVESRPGDRRPSSSSRGRDEDDFDTESQTGYGQDEDSRWGSSARTVSGSGRGTGFSGDRRMLTVPSSWSFPIDPNDVQAYNHEDNGMHKTCAKCKALPAVRVRRDEASTNSLITRLATEFIARGGLQSVQALMNSNDKMGTLKQILGYQVVNEVQRGLLGRLMGQYGGGHGGGGGGAAPYIPPSPTGSGRSQPAEGDGRWDPAPGTSGGAGRTATAGGGAPANPDDTEY
ncbi:hypothetical protein BV898_10876 [Hypsibius exemplaris]|uniref:Uncharacterized protein n=1 Tax=Hypsibius exemplaris TaxID=2072580 RepID=A0A1W0WID1_HYPEX|nr:hypothetical protein BV898_10876 [Hypsibius exemplaris]